MAVQKSDYIMLDTVRMVPVFRHVIMVRLSSELAPVLCKDVKKPG